jgi:hypothetical protein
VTEIADFLRSRYVELRNRQQQIMWSTWEPGVLCPVCSRPTSGMKTSMGGQSFGWPLASFEPCGHEIHEMSVMAQFEEPAPDSDVIADLNAKLVLIDDLLAERHEVVDGDCWYTCAAATEEADGGQTCDDGRRGGPCDCGRDTRVNRRLRILAQPFAGHPDHKGEEWTP